MLSLLVLFMLIGTAFMMSSSQYKNSALASAKNDRVGNFPTKLLDRAVMQVLRDTGNTSSVVRSHSLLRDLYGSEGFEAVTYSPIDSMLSARFETIPSQLCRYSTPTSWPNPDPIPPTPLGNTQGQLIDIFVRELAYKANDPLTLDNDATVLTSPDARHVLKLERSVLGLPQMHTMPLTKGYYNGCLLTITNGPARGATTRIVDYEYIGDTSAPLASSLPTTPFPAKLTNRLFRFRVMAFSRADGTPLQARSQLPNTDPRYSASPSRGRELFDLVNETRTGGSITQTSGVTFVVNGRPFNGTGAGFNELAKAGDPRLNAVEVIPNSDDPTDPAKALFPQIALAPNSAFTILSDPVATGNDLMGAGYFRIPGDPTSWASLNPKSIALIDRPLRWKYQTPAGPGDADESYDAPDFQNMALAMQTVAPRARGRVVQGSDPLNPATLEVDDPNLDRTEFLRLDLEDLPLPSFHRPDLVNYWFHRLAALAAGNPDGAPPANPIQDEHVRAVIAPYGADGIRGNGDDPGVDLAIRDQIVTMKRKFIMRPLREDHPNFDGSNPASRNEGFSGNDLVRNNNIAVPFWEAVGPWDVDNDNDGVRDSVWVDLGDPVAQAEDGTLYKPLYAFLVVDLDSRLNVNAHGLVDDLQSPSLDLRVNPTTGIGPGSLANDLNIRRYDGIDNDGDGAIDEADEFIVYSSNYLPQGAGYGPADISLRPIFPLWDYKDAGNRQTPFDANRVDRDGDGDDDSIDNYATLVAGRAIGNDRFLRGRYGLDVNPRDDFAGAFRYEVSSGITSTSPTLFASTRLFGPPDRHMQLDLFDYPTDRSRQSAFSNPPDLMGRYSVGLDYAGQPVVENAADVDITIPANPIYRPLLADSPYELDLSGNRRRDARSDTLSLRINQQLGRTEYVDTAGNVTSFISDVVSDTDDAPFATAELERILRAYDADSGILPDRLWNIVSVFDPLKLMDFDRLQVAQTVKTLFSDTRTPQQIASDNSSQNVAKLLAAAQQMAGITRRLVTTDSYDLPVPGSQLSTKLANGADGLPGLPGVDDPGQDSGAMNGIVDDQEELNSISYVNGSDDFSVVMQEVRNRTGSTTFPLLPPTRPQLIDYLRYRVILELLRKNVIVTGLSDAQVELLVNNTIYGSKPRDPAALATIFGSSLLAQEVIAGKKMDINRPFGDGRDNGDLIDNDGINGIDDPGEMNYPIGDSKRDPYLNGIVDDPAEAGEPFLDANGNGRYDAALPEKYIDVNANGSFDGPIDVLWKGLTSEPIAFDYSNGQTVPIHSESGVTPALGGGVRNLNNQGRQLYARQLYCLMLLLMDENYLDMPDIPSLLGSNLNQELQLIKIAQDNGRPPFAPSDPDKILARRKLTCQRIAQWAVNCVDFRDADAIMTAFEYDENPWDGWGCLDTAGENIPLDGDLATDENFGQIIDWPNVQPATGVNPPNPPTTPPVRPTKQITSTKLPTVPNRTRAVVWGAERPELLITETLAFHDRRCTDEQDTGTVPKNYSLDSPPAPPAVPDYDLDQKYKPRGSLFVELYNPWPADGPKCKEFYDRTPTDPTNSQGVMLSKLSNVVDPVSNKRSPVWRMSVLRDPLNGRMPIFRNPTTKILDSGLMDMATFPDFDTTDTLVPTPDPNDTESVSADFLSIDPDGYGTTLDEHAERHVYFTTGDDYSSSSLKSGPTLAATDESDPNRSDDNDWRREYTNLANRAADPTNPNLNVHVPPLAFQMHGSVPYQVSKRYFIARTERQETGVDNDRDITIAPILPGRYAVVGSSGQQLKTNPGGGPPISTPDSEVTDRFVTPMSRRTGTAGINDRDALNQLYETRRFELWPEQFGNPNVHQMLVGENGGPEFVQLDNNTVVNVTDLEDDGNPGNTAPNNMLIDPSIAIPIEDLSVSEPIEGYPSILYQDIYQKHEGKGLRITQPRINTSGEWIYDPPYDRPLDMDFELIRNGTTQNYRSVHLERLANPTLPWNPPPFDSYGKVNLMHRPWLPVNPYRTIDSQSVDVTAFNSMTTAERDVLPVRQAENQFGANELVASRMQGNVVAPITALQLLDSPDHVIWSVILLLKLKGVAIDDTPDDLRKRDPAVIEPKLRQLDDIEPGARSNLTKDLTERNSPRRYTTWSDGWWWHITRRVLPDDRPSGTEGTTGSFRQWLHLKSLERGYHASNYFKFPKPGAFYSANPSAPSIEGWAPDLGVLPRTLWKQERPNGRLFLKAAPSSGTTGIVDASDLKNIRSRRVLAGGARLTADETNASISDTEIRRNELIYAKIKARPPRDYAFDYVVEQTLGFANETFTEDIERQSGRVASTMLAAGTPKPGAPEIATQSLNRPTDTVSYELAPGRAEKEIWNAQRKAAKLNGSTPTTPQVSLLKSAYDNGTVSALVTDLEQEFYERRRLLTKSTFPWLTWNDRPMVSAEEIMQVPAASSSLMLRDYSLPTLFTPNPSVPVAKPIPPELGVAAQRAVQLAPYGHLLNMFTSSVFPAVAITNPLDPAGPPNFNRILDYIEVPSRYVGTETLLNPEVFNDPVGTDITSPLDPRYSLQPPFNKVSRERDPGRVNLNTVTGRRRVESGGFIRHWSEVYDGIMHRYGDSSLFDAANNVLQLGHFGPAWRDVVLSRKGYAQFNADGGAGPVEKLVDGQNQPETFAFGLNKDFPSLFSNPFRSADAGDLVPLPNMVRSGVEATWLRGIHWQRAFEPPPNNDNVLTTNPFAPKTTEYDRIAWGVFDFDDDGNGIKDDIHEAGYGIITNPTTVDGDTLRVRPSLTNALESSGIPLFSEEVPEPAIDGERNPGMMYQPMTRLGNLVTTRSNVYAIWVTVGYFEVEKAPDWNDSDTTARDALRARFGGTSNDGDDATVRARALYDRVYPDGYMLGEELGTDTGNTRRPRAFYIIDRTEPVGFKPGEDLNVDKMIRVRRRIE